MSGLAPAAKPLNGAPAAPFEPAEVVLALGVNDCEARLGVLPLEKIWRMLEPIDALEGTSKCFERAG